ncbi:MAG: hypothetical protein SF339_14230 [Blastocatellia bacterium]|nr:hypothetical protein [Blastocatellia bacterium]
MKFTLLFCLVLGIGLGSVYHSLHVDARETAAGFDVADQVNKTVSLSPGSNVRVSGINGWVKIETWDGDKAEINVVIKASDREAMDRRPIIIENTANSLAVFTEQDREGRKWGWNRGWVRHEVTMRVPRQINLKVSSVNGAVNVGAITGAATVASVNGRVSIEQAGSVTSLTSINGHTSVSMARLSEGGLNISSINGGVDVALPQATNAHIEVRSVNGGIDTDLPITVIGEMRRGQLLGTLGQGGPKINIVSVNGGVNLRRN